MIVVSDTSPINNLAAINQLEILRDLYSILCSRRQESQPVEPKSY